MSSGGVGLLDAVFAVSSAIAHALGEVTGEKLTVVRTALQVCQANLDIAEAVLKRVKSGDLSEQAARDAVQNTRDALAQSLNLLRQAVHDLVVPKAVDTVIDKIQGAIGKAEKILGGVATGLELGNVGGGLLVLGAAWYFFGGKKSKIPDGALLIGGLLLATGGGEILSTLLAGPQQQRR